MAELLTQSDVLVVDVGGPRSTPEQVRSILESGLWAEQTAHGDGRDSYVVNHVRGIEGVVTRIVNLMRDKGAAI